MLRYIFAYCVCLCLLQTALAVKVKVVMHSDEADSKIEEEESPRTESWNVKRLDKESSRTGARSRNKALDEESPRNIPRTHNKRQEITKLPFLKHRTHEQHVEEKVIEYEEEKSTTEKPHQQHPNELIFPLIYHQTHVNSMFKFGENWYTWSTEKRTDGSKAINYFICYDEPKQCDHVGWERTDALPRCAFEIDSVIAEDRACINTFGVAHRNAGSVCDGGELMKVSDVVRACGPRIRSLWRFVRVDRRPASATKPADVNSLLCEEEEECFISLEYRIHHDRITFSLHEPTRGQTFKSVLKREVIVEQPVTITPENNSHLHRSKIHVEEPTQRKKFLLRVKNKPVEGKGVVKERNDSEYANRRMVKNKIKIQEDISEDISE